MTTFTHNPLLKMKLTQPFGVDWSGGDLPLPNGGRGGYAALGLKGHNGLDFSANGDNAYAVISGAAFIDENSGYGKEVRIRNRDLGIEVIYGHLKSFGVQNNTPVKAGDLIAITDNTGISTGPHLHFGVRRITYTESGAGPFYPDYHNGFLGWTDPMPYFHPDTFLLPVDKRYGLSEKDRGYSDFEWYKVATWIYLQRKRLPTTQEKNALVWGRWDWRTMNDPAFFTIWTEMTKMEAKRQGLVR